MPNNASNIIALVILGNKQTRKNLVEFKPTEISPLLYVQEVLSNFDNIYLSNTKDKAFRTVDM